MKKLPFEPPTEYDDQKLAVIDEQICELINRRKQLSDNNPGFPTQELLATWANKFGMHAEFLQSVFEHFLNEDSYRPYVEPRGLIKNIPVLKYFEKDHIFYLIPLIRQYENASVVQLSIDLGDYEETMNGYVEHPLFELSIDGLEDEYDCREYGGGGSGAHMSYTFVISPPLPADFSGIKLVFREYKIPYRKRTGFQFIIELGE